MCRTGSVAKAVDSIQSHTTSTFLLFTYGGLAALKGDQQPLADMREEFDMRPQLYVRSRFQDSECDRGQATGAFMCW